MRTSSKTYPSIYQISVPLLFTRWTRYHVRNYQHIESRSLHISIKKKPDTEIIHLWWEPCPNISVFLTDRPYSLASTVVSVSIPKVARTTISIWYCNHPPHPRVFRYPTYLPRKSASVSCLGVGPNIRPSEPCIKGHCTRNIKNLLERSSSAFANQHHPNCLRTLQNHTCLLSN